MKKQGRQEKDLLMPQAKGYEQRGKTAGSKSFVLQSKARIKGA